MPPKKKKTRAYLEEALAAAKKQLPGWQYALIHAAAFPRSGARARHNPDHLEKLAIQQISAKEIKGMRSSELKKLFGDLSKFFNAARRKNQDVGYFERKGKTVYNELKRRGVEVKGALADACKTCETRKEAGGYVAAIRNSDFTQETIGEAFKKAYRELKEILAKGEVESIAMMIGPPGAGKSTYVENNRKSGVLYFDSVAARRSARKALLNIAQTYGVPVDAIVMGTNGDTCLKRNEARDEKRRVPDSAVLSAIELMDQEPPIPEEGFRAIEIVKYAERAPDLEPAEDPLEGAFNAFKASGNPEDIVNTITFVAKHYDGGLYLEDLNGDRHIGEAETDLEVEDGDTLVCKVEAGRPVVLGFADAALADLADDAAVAVTKAAEIEKARNFVPFLGSSEPRITFVGANPGPIEAARKEALVGPDGVTFKDVYLAPLSMQKADIAIGFVNPANVGTNETWAVWFQKEIDRLKGFGPVVALGKSAKEALGDRADFVLPHPSAVRRFGNSGEVDRKVKNIKKALDVFSLNAQNDDASVSDQSDTETNSIGPTDSNSGNESGNLVKLTKASEEKQIVYGVVLDPYVIDAHEDWIPPAEVERTAHGFVKDSRVIGLQHREAATAKVVESWIETYPTPFDYEQALANQPHKVSRREFGSDVIHSGTWVLGVELADQEWEAFKSGTFTGFSIGGSSFKTSMTTDVMPEVEYVDLVPES